MEDLREREEGRTSSPQRYEGDVDTRRFEVPVEYRDKLLAECRASGTELDITKAEKALGSMSVQLRVRPLADKGSEDEMAKVPSARSKSGPKAGEARHSSRGRPHSRTRPEK